MSRLLHSIENQVQTVGVVTSTLCSWTPASHSPVVNNCVVVARAMVAGKSSTNDVGFHEMGWVFKIISGTVSQVGSLHLYMAAAGNSSITTGTPTIVTTSNIITLQANGTAGATITWTGKLTLTTSEF